MAKRIKSIRPPCGGRPTLKESLEIQQRIVSAARKLFLTRGFEKTSMDLIAAEARLSKRTIYTRYPAKTALFEAVMNHIVEEQLAAFCQIKVPPAPLPEQLRQLATRLLQQAIVPEMIALERVIAGEAPRFPGLAQRVYCNGHHQVRETVAQLLIESGLYKGHRMPQAYRDADVFTALVVLPPLRRATLHGAMSDAVEQELLERSIEIFFRGIQSD